MGEADVEQVLWAFRERVQDLKQDRRFRYIIIFKNHGIGRRRAPRSFTLAAHRPADRAARGTGRNRGRQGALSRPRSAVSSATSSGRRRRKAGASLPRTRTWWRLRRTRRDSRSRRGSCRKRHQSAFEDAPRHEYARAGPADGGRAAAHEPLTADAPLQPADSQRAAARVGGGRLLPLARRDHSDADHGRGLRVGDRVSTKPDLP